MTAANYEMVEQGSESWRQLRLGKATASRIADIIAKTKAGWAASRKNYAAELITERLTGRPADNGYTSAAMQWGIDCEPEARTAYEFFRDAEVEPAPFVQHPTLDMAGASPDGFIGSDGLLEIKCPNTATHLNTLLTQEVPPWYLPQVQFQLACTGRQWCDWCSFDPRLPPAMQLVVIRVMRDDDKIDEVDALVRDFLNEVDDAVLDLRERFP